MSQLLPVQRTKTTRGQSKPQNRNTASPSRRYARLASVKGQCGQKMLHIPIAMAWCPKKAPKCLSNSAMSILSKNDPALLGYSCSLTLSLVLFRAADDQSESLFLQPKVVLCSMEVDLLSLSVDCYDLSSGSISSDFLPLKVLPLEALPLVQVLRWQYVKAYLAKVQSRTCIKRPLKIRVLLRLMTESLGRQYLQKLKYQTISRSGLFQIDYLVSTPQFNGKYRIFYFTKLLCEGQNKTWSNSVLDSSHTAKSRLPKVTVKAQFQVPSHPRGLFIRMSEQIQYHPINRFMDYLNHYPTLNHTPNTAGNRNPIKDSMISMMSEAFQFVDFLGETTTLKDKVPKNKADPNKKIVYFSREVNEQYTTPNPLAAGNINSKVQRRSAFDDYMIDTYPQTTTTASSVYTSVNSNYTGQHSGSDRYNESLRQQHSGQEFYGRQNNSLSSNLSFGDRYPAIPNVYSDKFNFSQEKTEQLPGRNRYDNYSENVNTSNTLLDKYSPNTYSSTANDDRFTITAGRDYSKTNGTTTTTLYSSFESSVKPTTSYDAKPAYVTKSYDQYGDYASDFSSPQIMALLRKRKNVDKDQGPGSTKEAVNWRDMNIPQDGYSKQWSHNY